MNLPEAIMNILSNRWGEDRAISRERLSHRIDIFSRRWTQEPMFSDRQIRAEIRKLRTGEVPHPYGPLICSHSSTGGYYLSLDDEDHEKSRDQKIRAGVSQIQGANDQHALYKAAKANAPEQLRML